MMNNLTTIQFLTIIPNKGANQLFLKWDFFRNGGSILFYDSNSDSEWKSEFMRETDIIMIVIPKQLQ